MVLFSVLVMILFSEMAFGQSFLESLADGSFVAKLAAFALGVQFILYGISTGLMMIAKKTETMTDNKIAAYFSQAAWLLGAFLGKFGYSVPKPLLEEKAKALNEKTD